MRRAYTSGAAPASALEAVAAALRDAHPAAVAALPLATRLAIARLGRERGGRELPLPAPPQARAPPAPPAPPARVFVALARTLQLEDVAPLPTAELAEVLVALRCGIARGGSVAVQDSGAAAALSAIEGELAQRDDLGELDDDAIADSLAAALAHVRSPLIQRLARELGRRGRAAAPAGPEVGGSLDVHAAAAAAAAAVAAVGEPPPGRTLRDALQRADLGELVRPRAARAVAARGAVASSGGDEARFLGPAFLSAGAVLATIGGIVSLVIAGTRQKAGAARRQQLQSVSRDDYLRFRARALGISAAGPLPPPQR
jgi:hypothetical protein